jgi:hypothetical protein
MEYRIDRLELLQIAAIVAMLWPSRKAVSPANCDC